MGKVNVDVIVYGFKATPYKDDPETQKSFKVIANRLAENKSQRYLAILSNQPW